jgi:hypothetical protein
MGMRRGTIISTTGYAAYDDKEEMLGIFNNQNTNDKKNVSEDDDYLIFFISGKEWQRSVCRRF